MKFSLRTEYGLRAMIDLAGRDGNGPTGAREIASRQSIPERFLEQQIASLRRAGLVLSQRGAAGGCSLARPAEEITVLDVIEALDGPVMNMDCITSKNHNCEQFSQCVVQELWTESQLRLREFLSSVTIKELVARQHELKASTASYQT